MINQALHERLLKTADEYHVIGEDLWNQVIELKADDVNTDELEFEYRRMLRAAIGFYARAFLALEMIETDDGQDVDELLEIVVEQVPELAEFIEKNEVTATLDEEGNATISRVFAVAEAVRTMLLERSNQLAASLGSRF